MDRKVSEMLKGMPVTEGAGVKLKRIFSHEHVKLTDPFLLLDHFKSNDPEDYIAGFPWHPHRGIETITYILQGRVEHGDSMWNKGAIGAGDVQWMTAGSGIIHQEMPKEQKDPALNGFQLWANLPASGKMMDPRYRDVLSSQIPVVVAGKGATVKVICGEFGGVAGPVKDIVTNPEYFDVALAKGAEFTHNVPEKNTVIIYVYAGGVEFDGGSAAEGTAVLLGHGTTVKAKGGKAGGNFLFITGKPLKEPVAWYGPIVMNTREELEKAFAEYEQGTFIKHK